MKDTHVSIAQWGNCKVCSEHKDLRYGSCFKCSDFVEGEQISQITHKLWDSRNPSNVWYASEKHN
jgi:hypothetical protein